VQHPLIEIDLVRIVKAAVVFGVDRAGQLFLHIEQRVYDALAIAFDRHVETPVAHRLEPGADRQYALPNIETHFAPLAD
jgi:hypothetical protein